MTPNPARSVLLLSTLAALATTVGCAPGGLGDEHGHATSHTGSFAYEADDVHGVDISVYSGRMTDEEMECFWDNGVRHVIVGTQELGTARQQLDLAVAHGMTVDTYVYLVWTGNVRAQVESAVALSRSYPVGMLWLDVEQDPAALDRHQLEDRLDEAARACGDFPCGIYTGGWWWNPIMGGSAIVADLPLWFANYDGNPDPATYPTQRVGPWTGSWGKQYAGDLRLCGIDVDLDTIRVTTRPSQPHLGRPAAPTGAPPAPTHLSPTGYELVPSWIDVRMIASTITGATRYEFAVESWNGSAYAAYYTWTSATSARSFSPNVPGTTYRFRVRATNGSGAGAWSAWSYFQYGSSSPRPPEPGSTTPAPSDPPPSTPTPTPSDPPPSTPPPPSTTSLGDPSPADGARVTSSSITMSRGAISGTHTYAFEVQYDSGGAWLGYYAYTGSTSTRTFWPAYANTAYRWRESVDGGAASAWAIVLFGASATAPGSTPSDPPPSPPAPTPSPSGAPTGLSPSATTITTGSVTLRCDAYTGATRYELVVEVLSGGTWSSYTTYTTTAPSKTFYPVTHGTSYRFRVRAQTASAWSPASSYATFDFR